MNHFARHTRLALVPILALAAACSNPVSGEEHARNITAAEIVDRANPATPAARTVAQGSGRGWDGSIQIPAGATRDFDVRFLTTTGQPFALGGSYSARLRFDADPPNLQEAIRENETVRIEPLGSSIRITAKAPGTVSTTLVLWHGSHDDWATSGLQIRVVAP